MVMQVTLDGVVRRGFSKEVTFELRSGERRVSINVQSSGRAFWAEEAMAKPRERTGLQSWRNREEVLGPELRKQTR